MKFIDLFAGIGGFRRGLELAGHECVGFCEIDKFAVASYTSMHLITDEQREYLSTLDMKTRQKEILKEEYRNGEWYADDIGTVSARDIPRADMWCFGFPCQDISVAGKGIGFRGNRSSLFFRVMYLVGQLAEEERPTYLFIENVKNLLSVNGGWDFARVLIEMDRHGYDAEWQILNSKNFGVPQNRERVFVIGHLRGRSTAEIFPVEGTDGANQVHGIGHRNGYRKNMLTFSPDGISKCLDTAGGGGRGYHTIVTVANYPSGNQKSGICDPDGIARTLAATDYKQPVSVVLPVLTPDRSEKRQNGRRFKEDGDPSFTLTGQDRHGVAVSVMPVEMNAHEISETGDYAHTLNTHDSRMKLASYQAKTMAAHIYGINVSEGVPSGEQTDIATTVSARDGKGLPGGWQKQTAVAVEVEQDE